MKKITKIIITIFCLYTFLIPSVKAVDDEFISYTKTDEKAEELPKVSSEYILLYNLNDNDIIYEKDINQKISIASLTKIMTSLVTIEKISNLDDNIKITKGAFYDTKEYALAGFRIGESVTYRDLLYGTMLPSGAEAAQQLALSVGGSLDKFVELMNEKAKTIGLNNTNFSNPIGRDEDDNYSTLEDLSKLLIYALNNETFSEIYTTKEYKTSNKLKLSSTLKESAARYNLNIDNILGSKSGYTNQAGLCLSSIAEYNNIKYLLITANAPYKRGYPYHIEDTINIYNYYFNNYDYQTIINKKQKLGTIDIEDGFEKEYIITSDEDIFVYLKNDVDLDKLEYKYTGINMLTSKIETNTKLGKIEVIYDKNILYTYDVYLNDTIKYKHTKLVLTIVGIILGLIILLNIGKKNQRKKRRRKYVKHRKK